MLMPQLLLPKHVKLSLRKSEGQPNHKKERKPFSPNPFTTFFFFTVNLFTPLQRILPYILSLSNTFSFPFIKLIMTSTSVFLSF